MSRRILGLTALSLAVLVAAAGAAASTRKPAALGTVTMRLAQDWQSLNPYVDAGRATPWAVASAGYDRLVTFGPKGSAGPYVPYLATSWKTTAKSITFKLRRDAKCTDGHVLTPVDVLNSIEELQSVPKRTGGFVSNSVGGFGPGPFHMSASNARGTFTLSSEKAYRDFPSQFAQIPIICPAGVAALKQNSSALDQTVYGSGPYTLESATHNDQVVWKLRPDWKWGPKGTSTKTMPQTLVYKVIADDTTAANLLLTGGLDIGQVTGPDVPRLLATKSIVHKSAPNYLTWNLVFMMRPGSPFAEDEKLREGIMTAINRQNFLQAATAGRGLVTPSVFRPGSECYDPKTKTMVPAPSLEKAKQILASDGWNIVNGKLTKDGKQLHVHLVLSQVMNQGPDYIDSVLNSLGIDVAYDDLPGGPYGTAVVTGNFDITILRGSIVAPDAGLNLFPFSGFPPPQGQNEAWTGNGDNQLSYYRNTGLANPGKAGCKVFALYQERLLQKHYLLPMIAVNFDMFGNNIDYPSVPPDQGAMPVFYIKAK